MEEFILENIAQILTAVIAICGSIISVTSFIKALRSENRTTTALNQNAQDIQITREGIVQAFKEATITKDLKVSVNTEVQRILEDNKNQTISIIRNNEAKRTKMMYWVLKILEYTAASNKLTKEEKAEIAETLSLIAEDEKIVDTRI